MSSFEALIATRMERFQVVLDKAKFSAKPYQYDGVKWCIENELRPNPPGNCRGGFIADEMGLGKTIMMIGTMFTNFVQRTLIVLPPVLISQWHKEILNATGHNALLYYGPNKKKLTQNDVNNAHIVLTSYNVLLQKNCLINNLVWSRVIFDEAHHLRNDSTQRFRNCKNIKAHIRWIVTGTPIQNRKKDFYNLCSMIGMKSWFYLDQANMDIIKQFYMLRRTKIQVGIDLPPVNNTEHIVEWQDKQEMLLAEELHSLIRLSNVSLDKKKRLGAAIQSSYGCHLTYFMRCRQVCVLPSLLNKQLESLVDIGLIHPEYLESAKFSSKLDAIINIILERKDNGKGKIIFCHFKEEIDFVVDRLLKGGLTKVVSYDGRNSGGENLRTLAEPADALVLQIQTGCEGLNLQTHFSEIYFVSPHWNPCIEDQAVARCHRIGQTKPVDVFKFVMRGFNEKEQEKELKPTTMETYVNSVQTIKRTIIKDMLDIQ
jgi:SNF2 family DNA or RNA helicase